MLSVFLEIWPYIELYQLFDNMLDMYYGIDSTAELARNIETTHNAFKAEKQRRDGGRLEVASGKSRI